MLEFLFDPTVIPVKTRVYFRPEEMLKNESYEKAKADAKDAYGDQRQNSDFYPQRNRELHKREVQAMDRRTLIASLDVLAQSFSEKDPIAEELKVMAYAVSKMGDEELEARMASDKEAKKKPPMFKCPKCGDEMFAFLKGKHKCKGKESKKKAAEVCPKCGKEECGCKDASDGEWTRQASEAVINALKAEAGYDSAEAPVEEQQEEHEKSETPEEETKEKGKKEEVEAKKEEASPAPEKKDEASPAPAKKEEVEAKKEEMPIVPEKKEEASPAPVKKEEVEAKAAPAPAPAPEPKKDEASPAPEKKDEVESKKTVPPAPVPEKEEDVELSEASGQNDPRHFYTGKGSKEGGKADKKNVVDTSVLSYEGIEFNSPMEDGVELTAEEKSQLDQLFQ